LKTRNKLSFQLFSEWHLGGRERPQFASQFGVTFTGQKEESELRFEVNGQMFFVNFVPEEGRWYCYAPTGTGVQKIPVSMDAAPFDAVTRGGG
jgi:hypothetical protein